MAPTTLGIAAQEGGGMDAAAEVDRPRSETCALRALRLVWHIASGLAPLHMRPHGELRLRSFEAPHAPGVTEGGAPLASG